MTNSPTQHDQHKMTTESELRERVFVRTARVLARRRWQRRGLYALVLMIAYGLGFASAWSGPEEILPVAEEAAEKDAIPDAEAHRPPEVRELSAGELEALARRAMSERRVEFWQRAGDRYLSEGDVEGALRCYGEVLRRSTDRASGVSAPPDTWLLSALKHSQP